MPKISQLDYRVDFDKIEVAYEEELILKFEIKEPSVQSEHLDQLALLAYDDYKLCTPEELKQYEYLRHAKYQNITIHHRIQISESQ